MTDNTHTNIVIQLYMRNIRFIAYALAIMTLSGCGEKKDFSYYMTHPQALRKEINRCQKLKPSAANRAKQQCDIVMNAAGRFMAQVTIQQADPETFGETIIKEEYILSTLKTDWESTQKTYQSLKEKNAPVGELKLTEDKMIATEKQYREKRTQVQELLAIVGLVNPG